MSVDIQTANGLVFLRIERNVTFDWSAEFKTLIDNSFDPSRDGLVVEFSAGVDYLCSSALGSMISLFRTVSSAGRDVFIVEPCSSKLRRLFELVHLPRLVTFIDDPSAVPSVRSS